MSKIISMNIKPRISADPGMRIEIIDEDCELKIAPCEICYVGIKEDCCLDYDEDRGCDLYKPFIKKEGMVLNFWDWRNDRQ